MSILTCNFPDLVYGWLDGVGPTWTIEIRGETQEGEIKRNNSVATCTQLMSKADSHGEKKE
jgi:hypothetical protein